MTSIANEEVLEIDLEEVKNSQPTARVSEEQLREEVDELRMRIREDFASDQEAADPETVTFESQEFQVREPTDELPEEQDGEVGYFHNNNSVELESMEPEEVATAPAAACDSTLEVDLDYMRGTMLNEQEIEDALEATTSDLERLEEDEVVGVDNEDDEDEDEDEEDSQGFYQTPITIIPPPFVVANKSESILLYGPSGIVEKLPHRDTSLDQVFETLRTYYDSIPTEKELYLCMPQLDLELGEDNIYCNDTTVVDLLRLLDTCDEYPSSLEIKIECRNRFISKLNSLFDILNDLPPGKRRKLSVNSTEGTGSEPAEAVESGNTGTD